MTPHLEALASQLHAFDYANKKRGSHIADGLNRMQDLVDGPLAGVVRDAGAVDAFACDSCGEDWPADAKQCPDCGSNVRCKYDAPAALTQPQGGEVVAWRWTNPTGFSFPWFDVKAVTAPTNYPFTDAGYRVEYAYSRPHDSRDDTARLDWLLESHANVETDGADNWRVVLEWTNPETYFPYADSRRAAIDAARGQGES